MSYKSVWDFGRGGKANYSVHAIGEYPSKIRPLVFRLVVERFSKVGDVILDPFCGSGTLAVEAKLQGRSSLNYDINPNAITLTQTKLNKLTREEIRKAILELLEEEQKNFQTNLGEKNAKRDFKQVQAKKEVEKLRAQLVELEKEDSIYLRTEHLVEEKDARIIELPVESVDAVITDIPYASMIRYSDKPNDLSTLDEYPQFLEQLKIAFDRAIPALKKGKYFVVFTADYRVGASRCILPVHSDVIQMLQDEGLVLFDTYIWRYYRSGGFRPFGMRPFQAMNIHTYILVFYKPTGEEKNKKNRGIRYRKKLVEKINNNQSK